MDSISNVVFKKKYAIDENETPEEMWRRIAKAIASVEGTGEKRKEWEEKFYSILKDWKFVPGGRILFGAGNTKHPKITLLNCFVNPIKEDSLEGIFDTAKEMARTYSWGGGVGIDISILRPAGSNVRNAAKESTGSTSFMHLYSLTTGLIGQCLSGDTLVKTKERGLTRIKDLHIGDEVWTEDGWRKVVRKIVNSNTEVYKVRTTRGYEIKASLDHEFYIPSEDGKSIKGIRLKDLKVGDEVVMIRGDVDGGWYRHLPLPHEILNNIGAVPFTEELAYFLGNYYADGYNENGTTISITTSKRRLDVLRKIEGIVKKYFLASTTYKEYDNYYVLIIRSKFLRDFLKLNNLVKPYSRDLYVPDVILHSPSSVQLSFVAGVLDGDGHIGIYEGRLKSGIRISSSSHTFITQIQQILNSNGIVSRILYDNRKSPPIYYISITGKEMTTKFVERVGSKSVLLSSSSIPIPSRESTLSPFLRKKGDRYSLATVPDSDYSSYLFVDRIVEITPMGEETTYDISLNSIHKFYANGFYVSNSGRRGALMITIDISHPDVELFIKAKSSPDSFTKEVLNFYSSSLSKDELKLLEKILVELQIKYANISVKLRDDFMKAVENDDDWKLWYPVLSDNQDESMINKCLENGNYVGGDKLVSPYDVDYYEGKYVVFITDSGYELREKRVFRIVKARELWDLIVSSAWERAEPGILMWDNIIRNHNAQFIQPLLSTNPCSEKPLPAYGNCDLGSINLSKFVKNGNWDWEGLKETVKIAVRFLDNVIDYTKYPLPQHRESSLKTRRIGLGIMGLADALIKMKVKYDSPEALEKVSSLMEFLRNESYKASIELAKEKGSFIDGESYLDRSNSEFLKRLPDEIKEDIRKFGIRNSEILSIAPTGSISMLAGVSSGIEPIFAFKYERYVLGEKKTVYHPLVKEFLGRDDDKITDEDLRNLPPYFVSAHEIDYDFRVSLQGIIQKYVDSAISSTVNLPESTTKEEISRIFFNAWREGLKGITIYREGSREGIIKINKQKKNVKTGKFLRPLKLDGTTYKIKYRDRNWYITVNHIGNKPIEIFAHSSNMSNLEWATALSRLISAVLRRLKDDEDYEFIINNLYRIREINGTGYTYRKDRIQEYIPSEPAIFGLALRWFKEGIPEKIDLTKINITPISIESDNGDLTSLEICPVCGSPSLLKGAKAKAIGGCSEYCTNCGYSKCS